MPDMPLNVLYTQSPCHTRNTIPKVPCIRDPENKRNCKARQTELASLEQSGHYNTGIQFLLMNKYHNQCVII